MLHTILHRNFENKAFYFFVFAETETSYKLVSIALSEDCIFINNKHIEIPKDTEHPTWQQYTVVADNCTLAEFIETYLQTNDK